MIRLPTELTQVLKEGGTVVVPSRQRAHAARLAYAAAELSEGRRVWATPDILPVEAWLTREIEDYAATSGTPVPRLLSPAEEWFLWRQCAAEATGELELVNRGALAEALRRASAVAADFGIEVGSATRSLSEWGADDSVGTEAALLAEVQRAVEARCREMGAATGARLVEALRGRASGRVVASGFLSISPRLRPLVNPLHETRSGTLAAPGVVIASDELDELERIAQWCRQHVERDPGVRILIAMPGAPGTRERLATLIRQAVDPRAAFDASTDASSRASIDSLVVIEGGVPLARVPAVAHALATLSWLSGNAGDFEAVSSWLRAPYWQTPGSLQRARLDIWLRERERMHFDLHELVGALSAAPSALASTAREIAAQVNKAAAALGQGSGSPRDWSERIRAALEVFGWPGERARASGEQQTVVRLHELLDEFGQLASAARSISRDSAIQWFSELATRTAFRPADDDAVITISSVLAAPVVRYDAIWVAGLHAEAFPQPVQPDPFIPLGAQLAAGVPAASAGGRLGEAHALLAAWREGADELVLSAPARSEDLELLPSPLLAEWISGVGHAHGATARAAAASHGSVWLPVRIHREGVLETFEDAVGLAWPITQPLPSGTRSLELQNQCPFRAYAELRLGSTPLDAPEPGIAADLRGQLLHAALQKLWEQLRDSQGLAAMSDVALDVAIHRCVEEAADETVSRMSAHRAPRTQAGEPPGMEAAQAARGTELASMAQAAHPTRKGRKVEAAQGQGDLFGGAGLDSDPGTARAPAAAPNPGADTGGRAGGGVGPGAGADVLAGTRAATPDARRSPALVRECRRAERLIRALCAVERERAPFRVESTELDSTLTLVGAQLRIRIDRVDALESGGRAILDYKSGRRSTADWYGERPSHPQLLAYLAALGEDVVAMATVNVTAREVRFDGIANSAELLPKVKGVEAAFGTDPSDAWPSRRDEWLVRVEHLARDFLAGRAVVDPKPGACDYCHVASVCRIADRTAALAADAPGVEGGHE